MSTPTYRHGLANCPGCQTALVAPFPRAGGAARCNRCATRFTLPDAQELFENAVAYLLEHDIDPTDHTAMDTAGQHIRRETMAGPTTV